MTQAVERLSGAHGGARPLPGISLARLEVDDVDAMCAELTARGVELLNGPIDLP